MEMKLNKDWGFQPIFKVILVSNFKYCQ